LRPLSRFPSVKVHHGHVLRRSLAEEAELPRAMLLMSLRLGDRLFAKVCHGVAGCWDAFLTDAVELARALRSIWLRWRDRLLAHLFD
jgi:hypothetical protein